MTFDEIVSSYLDEYACDHEVHLRFGDCPILFRTNDEGLSDFLGDYFTEFLGDETDDIAITVHAIESPPFDHDFDYSVRQPDPGKSKIKEEWIDLEGGRIVRKVLTDLVCIFGGEVNLAIGPCRKNDSQVINFIIHRYIEWLLRHEGLLLHAAGVSLAGRGIALAGFSGMGKSTLALHLMNEGTDFVSNDRAIVRSNGDRQLLYGVPKMPRINPGTILHNPVLKKILSPAQVDHYSGIPGEELWDVEDKHDALIHQLYGGGKFKLKVDMHGLVVLNWGKSDAETAIEPIDISQRNDLLPAFTKSTGLFNDPQAGGKDIDASDQAYIDYFSRCPLYEITGRRDFSSAVEQCLKLIR